MGNCAAKTPKGQKPTPPVAAPVKENKAPVLNDIVISKEQAAAQAKEVVEATVMEAQIKVEEAARAKLEPVETAKITLKEVPVVAKSEDSPIPSHLPESVKEAATKQWTEKKDILALADTVYDSVRKSLIADDLTTQESLGEEVPPLEDNGDLTIMSEEEIYAHKGFVPEQPMIEAEESSMKGACFCMS